MSNEDVSDATPTEPVRRLKVAGSNLRGKESLDDDDDGDDDDDDAGLIKEAVTDRITAERRCMLLCSLVLKINESSGRSL